jgi:ribonuclease Z
VEFEGAGERGVVVYSCDTSPCPSIAALATGADVLIHEATWLHDEAARALADGHTTAYQAGEVARQAGVKRLFLCHFHADLHERLGELQREAGQAFGGPVEIPEELREYRVD